MTFQVDIITLFPELFPGPLNVSVLGRGLREGIWNLNTHQLRDFAMDKHKTVDDTPSGGGPGMVLRADILGKAIDVTSSPTDTRPRILLSPRGEPLTQKLAHELAREDGLNLICGRFEGVDERIIEARNLREISIGDYILTGGESAAIVLLETVLRLRPGLLGSQESASDESFENNRLEYPQYTRPAIFEGREIPSVLTSGDHQKVDLWRAEQSQKLTEERRPDLLKKGQEQDK